jgi:hypothetical protein
MSLMMMGTSRFEIIQTLRDEWKCSEKLVDYYMSLARKEFEKNTTSETKYDMRARYDHQYYMSLNRGDVAHMTKITDSIMKFFGYAAAEKQEITHTLTPETIKLIEIKKDDDNDKSKE